MDTICNLWMKILEARSLWGQSLRPAFLYEDDAPKPCVLFATHGSTLKLWHKFMHIYAIFFVFLTSKAQFGTHF